MWKYVSFNSCGDHLSIKTWSPLLLSIPFIKSNVGNNFISDYYRAAIKTEILLKLPIYSVDRLIYEELLATENEYSRVIMTILDSNVPVNKNSLTYLQVEGMSLFFDRFQI